MQMRQLVRLGMISLTSMALLSACGKTVSWEEEVLLNTGEVIWVERISTYKLQGDAGNPFNMSFGPVAEETLKFKWSGRRYSYTGSAGLMMVVIPPGDRRPALIAAADSRDWHWKNDYRCTTPFYVQFIPVEVGQKWKWMTSIDPALYGLPYNLMAYRPRWGVDEMKEKYSIDERIERDRVMAVQSPHRVKINPTYKSDTCFN